MPTLLKSFLIAGLVLMCTLQARADSNSLLLPGPVIHGHAKYENECNNCHKSFDKAAQSGLCKDCHKDIGKDLSERHGYHGLMKEQKECKECHTEHKGRDARIAKMNTVNFDHLTTGFELKGAHLNSKVLCKDCHLSQKKYRQAPTKCIGCHEKADKHKGGLGPDCENCHEEKDWKTTHFDHSKTHFELLGKHKDVKCKACHIDEKYKDTPKLCNECHKKDDDKVHKGKFGPKCETCHNANGWKEITFDHDKQTKYPLLGKHKDAKCTSCHKGELYKDKLKSNCYSCHKKEDDKVHKSKFGAKCESCHVERSWKEIPFDHDKKTRYPLLGKHKDAKCASCHKGDLYKDKLKTDCNSCHQKDDKHKSNFGAKCESCHTERSWKEILFDHDKKTKYPLSGKHHDAKCVSCHKGDLYKDKLKSDCYSCHQKDDKHKDSFGQKCEACHVERGWKEILFDHDKKTKYPLQGKHRDTKCVSCHMGDLYKDKLKSDCYSCHKKDDKHKGQEGNKCESCHRELSWTKVEYDHRMARFPLTGKHLVTECKKCHVTVAFKDAKSDCWSCHEKQDLHKLTLGTACETCHNTRDWKGWDFDHNKTSFKLDGKHQALKCADCHKIPTKRKLVLATTCYSCHDKDDRHDGEFGTQCEHCHIGENWKTIKVGSQNWIKK